MGSDIYHTSPVARQVFQEADAVLGFSLTATILEGPDETLLRTENAQPALLCVSIAYLRAMEERLGSSHMPQASFMAGHSLGEYTALVATGAIDLATGLRLVRRRGELMQMAADRTPSGMAAVLGLDLDAARALCNESGAQLANVNTPTQMVIAGPMEALDQASTLAKERGARRVIPLEVSGAFHTEVMRPAQADMERALEAVPFRQAAVPVIANTTARPVATPLEVREELGHQLCACVWWQQSIEYMLSKGVTRFIEIGPGRVLSNLVRHIHQDAETISMDMDRLDALVSLA